MIIPDGMRIFFNGIDLSMHVLGVEVLWKSLDAASGLSPEGRVLYEGLTACGTQPIDAAAEAARLAGK